MLWFYTHCVIAIVILIADARGTLEPTVKEWEKKLAEVNSGKTLHSPKPTDDKQNTPEADNIKKPEVVERSISELWKLHGKGLITDEEIAKAEWREEEKRQRDISQPRLTFEPVPNTTIKLWRTPSEEQKRLVAYMPKPGAIIGSIGNAIFDIKSGMFTALRHVAPQAKKFYCYGDYCNGNV